MLETIGLVVFVSLIVAFFVGYVLTGFVVMECHKSFMDAYVQFKEFRQRLREMKLEETARKRVLLAKMEREIAELRALPLHSDASIGVARDTTDDSATVMNGRRQQVCA